MPNAEDISLFVVVVGNRGGGKTLLLTQLAREKLWLAGQILKLRELTGKKRYLPKRKTTVFTSYPIKDFHSEDAGCDLHFEKLDVNRLIAWKPEYENCYVIFDEIGLMADRQDWHSPSAKLLNAGIQVMRHRNISFLCSIQSLQWLNSRMQWQTDIIVKCRDASYTPWGRGNHVQPGEVINTIWLDKSGVMTGTSYEENHRFFAVKFYGRRCFNAYETNHEFDVMGTMKKYEIERDVVKFNSHGDVLNLDAAAKANAIEQDIFDRAINYFKYNGPGEFVTSEEFKRVTQDMGYMPGRDYDWNQWGKYLTSVGVKRKSVNGRPQYNFDNAEVV
jgi:hypothetical protein